MDSFQFLVLLVLLGAVCVGIVVVIVKLRRNEAQTEAFTELERALSDCYGKANADMAARVEQIKGDLRVELTDRLQHGLGGVRETVDRQLDALALKQTEALRDSRTALTNALGALTTGLREKLDRMVESQSGAARDARAELGKTLGDTTRDLISKFEGLETKTLQHLENIRGKVDEKLQSISDSVQQKLEKNIQEGFSHFQKVQEHLKAAEEQLRNVGVVGQSINELNTLLKLPHLRGKFGEAELGRLLADFLPAAAYEEQVVVVPGSTERVDAMIRYPNVKLPIDSKFSREQILPLFETSDPQVLATARETLATVMKAEARSIREKYIHPEHGTAEMALMFIPSETIYFEVIRNGALCEALHKQNVFPVSPNTLAITLKSVAMSFGYYEFAKNVEKTLEQIRKAQARFGLFQKKFDEIGKGLEKAQSAYGTAASHLGRYANNIVQLTGEEVPELDALQPALLDTLVSEKE